MDPNTKYELFTLEVYQLLATYSGSATSSVQHNVKLKGKSGFEHQVDVYWEYEKDGEVHRVAIECKNYNQKISIGRVRDFFGVLHDVGNVKGIMACKEGCQDGAKKFADYYGISLMELRAPKDEETIIGTLDIKWDINVTHQLFLVDEEWAAKHKIDLATYRERLDFIQTKRDNNTYSMDAGRLVRAILEDALGGEKMVIM